MATNVEVVKVSHDQLKRRVEITKKAAGHDDQTGKTNSQFVAEKEEKHPTKSRSTKARKEKDQRKPDQQLYRPGKSRMARNSSSAGSDLNSSRDESPTKPLQTPVNSKEVGSKGDQVCHVGEDSLSKDLPHQVEADHGAVQSKNQGHQRYEADKPQRGDRSGGRHGRMDRKDDSGNNHARRGSRPKDKQEPFHQRKLDRPARQESLKIPDIGKTRPEGDDHGHEETWEIKPEDWETDTKSHKIKSDGKGSEAKNPPKHVQGGNSRENLPKHVHGRSRNESPSKQVQGRSSVESPPKHMQGRSGKGRHDDDIGHKERKQKIHEDSKVSENKPQELESLMGSDWDKEFEQQVQAQHSPKKSTDPHRRDGTKQHETDERLPQSRSNQTSGQSYSRQDQGARSNNKKGHSKMEMDKSHKEPKKDVVKLSRQNYASEIQKLRAKKEQMEKDGSGRDEFETVPSAKDLQITVKAVSGNDGSSRVVQEKSSKSSSPGRAQQRMDSENSTRSEKPVMDQVLTLPDEWEDDVGDLNFHIESMVITNQKFRNKDFDDSGGCERRYEERRKPLNRDGRFQNEDHGDRVFEKKHDERNKPQNRNDRLQNRDHSEKGFERKHDEKWRPTNRDEKQTIQHDHASKRSNSSNSNSQQKDQRSDRRYRDEELHRSGNERWHMDKEESHRMEKERHEHRRGAADERFEDDRHHSGGEPERHQKEQDHRRGYHSEGRKETTRTRDRVSVSSDDGRERQGRRRGSSEAEDSSTSHGGGILRLPGKVEHENTHPQHGSYVPVYDQFYQPPEGHTDAPLTPEEPKAKPKGRTGDQSRLWDPSKPNQKPALQQHQVKHDELHFQDPEMDKRDSRGEGTPPAAQQELWNSYIPNYPPGFSGMMQPPYGYPSPPPGYPVPNPSWANQVDGAQGYKLGHPPLPPPHMMQYAPPYGGHSYPLPPGMPYHPGYNNPPHAAMLQEHQSVNRQSAQKLLRDAARCETELYNALSHGISMRETLQQLLDKQQELEQLYEGIILLDLDLCNQYNVEQTLWKNSYYQLIEALRKAIQEQPNGDSYKEDLLDFMQHGTTFYEGLLNKLQSTYHFQLENRTGLDPLHEEPRRSIKLALLSAQRCMIALGDIARYKEQASETNNYGKARSWYMKAQHLAPRNGRPYNQLAILALYTRRKLDAVYFYVRSLAATNPFLTARESLMTLFEEVRRKVEHKEQEEMEVRREMERRREQRRKRRRRPSHDENRGRKEVWVAHDGKMVGGEKMEEEEEEGEMEKGENLAKLSAAELNKKFVLSFLNVHGKLFTKTGMEAFDHATEHLLREFKALLDHSPSAILSTRLIQLMAINMFAVANTSPQGDSPSSADSRPLLLEQAVQLGLNMFALLCLRCCSLLQDHLDQQDTDQSVLSQDLHELLPGVKVYADWMMCHPKLWNPPPSCNTTSYSSSLDVWSAVAQFLNLVKRVAVPDVKFAVNNEEDSLEVLLPEDVALSGFVPLMALPLQPVFIQADTSKILANDRVRLDSLTMFGEYLSGQETPLISFSVKTDSYVSIAPKALPRRETEHSYLQAEDLERVDDGNDDVIVMDSYIEDEVPQGDGTISRLRERRDSLEKQLRDRELRDAHIQAIVESHRSQRVLEIVIKPYFLVPDTNCFIDHLPAIQRLVTCQRYLMVIPLVVINELDGLARGNRDGQYSDPHHAVKVQHGARYAIEYLEEEFANRNRCLQALTSKGSTMDTIRFRSEEAELRGNNDDHILRCCMHYCSDNARQYMPADKDAPLQIEREVVLLTNDRNLRVKAIQQNVPVKDIILFVRWAKV